MACHANNSETPLATFNSSNVEVVKPSQGADVKLDKKLEKGEPILSIEEELSLNMSFKSFNLTPKFKDVSKSGKGKTITDSDVKKIPCKFLYIWENQKYIPTMLNATICFDDVCSRSRLNSSDFIESYEQECK